MITPFQVELTLKFLAQESPKLTAVEIARLVGIHRHTVKSIADGKRNMHSGPLPFGESLCVLPQRVCPACGKVRIAPCPACRAEECDTPEQLRQRHHTDAIEPELKIELEGKIKERYLAKLAEKRKKYCQDKTEAA